MLSEYDYLTVNGELSHHGILGQKWGVRRYQNPDGSLTAAGKKRYQYNEYRLARKTQKLGYKNSYDRMLDYQKKSKIVQERAKELKPLSDKANDLRFKLEDYEERDDVYDEALKKSTELAKKQPDYGKYGEKYDDDLIDFFMYDKDVLKKTANEMNKSDPTYNELRKEYKQTIRDYKSKCKEITDDIIGEYGDNKIRGLGTDMNYREMVHYALTKSSPILDFTYEEEYGRK